VVDGFGPAAAPVPSPESDFSLRKMLTPPLIGLAFERMGSYTSTFVLLAAGQLVATVMFFALGPYRFSTRGP